MAWKSREEGPITVEWLVFGIQNVVAFEAEVTAETRLDELGFDWLNLTRGQWLCTGMVLAGIIVWLLCKPFPPKSDTPEADTPAA